MTADINHGWLDPATVLTIRDAADLCGVSIRALERDHKDPDTPFQLIKRDRHNFASVQSLIDSGRYTPGQVGRTINQEVEHLRARDCLDNGGSGC